MGRKIASTLTTVAETSRLLEVPVSSLRYWLLVGEIKPREYGPVVLIDVEQARSALKAVGYTPRQKQTVS